MEFCIYCKSTVQLYSVIYEGTIHGNFRPLFGVMLIQIKTYCKVLSSVMSWYYHSIVQVLVLKCRFKGHHHLQDYIFVIWHAIVNFPKNLHAYGCPSGTHV